MHHNPKAPAWTCAPAPHQVLDFHRGLTGYAPTPLTELPALAAALGVRRLLVKDESARLGLPAFKVLGASWAVHNALLRDRPPLLVTATDGNHGRAVARTARTHGIAARVYVPSVVSAAARAAIAGEGAELRVVPEGYDDAVRQAAADRDGLLVQDTAWPGYTEVPGWIVQGYSTMLREVDAQLPGGPDLVVVPVGVGSLAQAVVEHYRAAGSGTAVLGVEPDSAACLLTSLRAGGPVAVRTAATVMAGLNCGVVSSLAWPVLRDGLDAAVAVTDAQALAGQAELAAHGVRSGPSGAAALAGLRAALAADLPLPDATVVLLSTEGHHADAGDMTQGDQY